MACCGFFQYCFGDKTEGLGYREIWGLELPIYRYIAQANPAIYVLFLHDGSPNIHSGMFWSISTFVAF